MENEEKEVSIDTVESTPDPRMQPSAYAEHLRSERLKENAMQPDFSIPNAKSTDMVFKESVMRLTPMEIDDIMRNSGFRESAWKQTGVAVENALTSMNQMTEQMSLAIGNLENYITGGQIGEELQNISYEALNKRMSRMALNEEAVGGVRNFWAQVVGGATSFAQLALESVATAGILPSAQIGIQAFGEGTYNDMKKYADEHDGSLVGYRPKGTDVAINTANTLFQVGSEAWLGVGSPRFMRGWSRGFTKEAASGFVQESLQGVVQDFAEIAKGNKSFEDMLNNADQYLIDGVIGAMLQGPLGAVTYSQARRRSDTIIARAHAIAKGRKTPVKEDFDVAKKLNDAKERNYASALNTEFKAAFDASTGEGKLQQNIVSALNKAVEAKELDLGVDNETDRAQKLEQIATQETLNAMEMAQEQGKAISEMELNNIVYRDGSIYLEGYEPEIGERAVDRARVIAERQSGLADVQMKLDNLSQEVQQTKKELAEAKVANQQALADKLQARLDKQNALLEKRKLQTEKLIEQTEKIQKQIEQQLSKKEKTTTKEIKPVEPAEPKTVEPLAKVSEKIAKKKGEKRSLKAERKQAKAKQQPVSEQEPELLHQTETEQKELVVTHGTTLSKLKEALNLGGMPVPSLAISKAEHVSKQYGEITFVGGKYMLNKEPVYTSDIYSARRVKADILINEAGEKYIRNLLGSHASFLIGNLNPDYGNYQDALMHLYLLEKGARKDPENILRREGADFTQEFSKMSDSEQKEFIQWQKDFENKYFDKKIWAGYTPSGKQKYIDYTLENIVKIMAKKPTAGSEEGFGTSPHALKGVWAKPLKTIEAIRKNKDRLVSQEEYKKVDEEFWDSMNKLTNLLRTEQLVKNLPYSYDEHIIATLMEIKNNTDIKSLLQQNDMNYSDEAVQAVKDFKTFAESVPTKYFEAKPKRAVNFNEFNGVIMPTTSDYDAVAKRLADMGLQVERTDNVQEGIQNIDKQTPVLFQSKVEGTGSDKYRGGYDERLKRIILGEKSDLTTIQHEFAHYWIQNNFKWARSGLASAEWLSRWRNVEEALGIEPRDRYLSRQASEKFARAYEQYILQDKIDPDLQWAFDGFQKFYAETYEDLENEYFDLSEELDPAIVDWFNRQRPVTEQALKDQQYKKVADAAMAQGVSVITPVSDGNYVVSTMNENGEVQSDVVVTDEQAQGSKLAQYRDKKGKSGVVEGLREATGQDLPASEYNVLNRAETVEQAREWIANDRQGAWDAMTSDKTNIIDRTALFQAFKEQAENGDYELGAELANTKFPSAMTEVGQALSVLGERSEYDPLTILEMKQKALGEPTVEELGQQVQEMNLDAELDADQVKELEETTECVL